MKATGIVRRIDELGRIVIPKEIRRTLRIQESDPMEIYMGDDGSIQLKKYSSVGGLKEVAEQYVQALNGAFGLTAAVTDKEACVAAAGRQRRWLLGKPLLDAVRRRLLGRQVIEEGAQRPPGPGAGSALHVPVGGAHPFGGGHRGRRVPAERRGRPGPGGQRVAEPQDRSAVSRAIVERVKTGGASPSPTVTCCPTSVGAVACLARIYAFGVWDQYS